MTFIKKGFMPDWTEKPPKPGSWRSIFKWGDPKGFKHPNSGLYEMMKELFEMTDDDFRRRQNPGDSRVFLEDPADLDPKHLAAFQKIVGKKNVAVDAYSRIYYAHGKTMEETIRLRHQAPKSSVSAAIHPRNKKEVERVVQYCNEHKIPIYPFGGGSSVTGGLTPVAGGISLVLKTHLNRVVEIDETDQTAVVQAGMFGPAYEEALNNAPDVFGAERRYTCGHFPQSFEFSTVGGWIVTLGSGQQSTYYGDAYDIVLAQEYVTPVGSFTTHDYPATATGPKLNDIMKGSEGSYGVLVEAKMKIFRYMPENRRRFAFLFPNFEAAVEAGREIVQGEFGAPSVFRISDGEETDVAMKLYGVEGTPLDKVASLRGLAVGQRSLLIGAADGENGYTDNVKKNIKRVCKQYGAQYLTGLPVHKWEHSRYRDPYLREDLQDYGIIIDTLEAGVTWSGLHRLHQGVRAYVKSRPRTVCMTHASHFYPQGTNLYFIFIARMNDVDEYLEFQQGVIEAIHKNGGSLSHHHGVGKMIAPWMESHLGSEQMGALRALKKHFDPNNILNPGGTLGLDLPKKKRRG